MRQHLVVSAVAFLRDPEVASAPMANKIEFLESKKLTSEEIQEAVRLANDPDTDSSASQAFATYDQPPPIPARDWRDYFIMSTVSVGVMYGLYQVSKRYILPLLMPSTPEELEVDKLALGSEFEETNALLAQFVKDTQELKDVDEQCSRDVDESIEGLRTALKNLKYETDKRDEEFNYIKYQVDELMTGVPRAVEKNGSVQKHGLKEIQTELKSLRNLVGMRVKASDVTQISSLASSNAGIPSWQLAGNQ